MPPTHDPRRRELLAGLMAGAAVTVLPGCSSCPEHSEVTEPTFTGDTSPVLPTGDTAEPTVPTDTGPVPWLTGGTAALAEDYDIDWPEGAGCALSCMMTLGPCHQRPEERQDISEGEMGLPTRMAFRVLDIGCRPVEGAVVDVWHCSPDGLYSGDEVAEMCHGNDQDAKTATWFRGTGTTDADGLVHFDTCMPGWYPGRAVHVHFQVFLDNENYVISQLAFDEAMVEDIFTHQPDYSGRGLPDTSNERDGIVREELGDTLFDWRKAEDGALVVWKTLVIRENPGQPIC